MFVSDERERSTEATEWLGRQLAWEAVLQRLRREAGVEEPAVPGPAVERPAA